MSLRPGLLVLAATLLAAGAAHAHHVSGTVYCDVDWDGVVDRPGDTPLAGVTVRATSLDVAPGSTWTDGTDGAGAYWIGLPARTDRYRVEPVNLAPGYGVVLPAGGAYVVQIITRTAQDHADGLDFLVQGCAPRPTTTTTSTTTTTTTTSTTTTTTTLPVCDCAGTPFLVDRDGHLNNDADIQGSVGANAPDGRFRLGRNVVMADDTTIAGARVEIGPGSSVFDVRAIDLRADDSVIVRNGVGQPVLPLLEPFCTIPEITCGTEPVDVGAVGATLAPGRYGALRVLNGASLRLEAGTYAFCDVKMGRGAAIETVGDVTLDVLHTLTIGSGSRLAPLPGEPLVQVHVAGHRVRLSQSAVAEAAITAPDGKVTLGRDSLVRGCFCSDTAKSDKHITLVCEAR